MISFRHRRWVLLLVLLSLGLAGCAKRVVIAPDVEPPAAGPPSIEHRVAPGETLMQIADNYYGDPAAAERIARANGISDPDHLLPGSLLRLEFEGQEWDSARRRSSALEPYNRGVDLLAQDHLGEAERQFRLAAETAPELVGARYNLALVLMKRGRNTDALVLLDELIRQRPQETDFHFARGNALFQLARFDEAAGEFGGIVDHDPDHRRALFSLARSLQESGQVRAARRQWQRYLELDPDSSWATAARRHLKKLDDGDRP